MTAGRPSLYTPELLQRAREYVSVYQEMGQLVPTVAGLALYLEISRDTCYAWENDPEKPEFSDILDEISKRQEIELVNKGLGGAFNAPITKMMMTKHGYSDRVDTDHTSSDGSMTPPTKIVFQGVEAKPRDRGSD